MTAMVCVCLFDRETEMCSRLSLQASNHLPKKKKKNERKKNERNVTNDEMCLASSSALGVYVGKCTSVSSLSVWASCTLSSASCLG